ncbi:MAG: START domain-containing protein [Gammaproteobacteria bacterium]|nr:START domain-containing protein [Gammaproteobacteria bacterium]
MPQALAQDWNLQRDREGIKIFTRNVDNSKFKQVKAVMQIQSTLAELVALVRDTSACPEWAQLCKKAEEIEVLSETDLYVYTLNTLPWPVSDRDAVAHILWQQDATTFTVTMTANLVSGKLPTNKGVVRLTQGTTQWIFTPIDADQILVTSTAHIDPAGAIPTWLVNRLLVDSPFNTLKAMRKAINSHRYAGATYAFLSEPSQP